MATTPGLPCRTIGEIKVCLKKKPTWQTCSPTRRQTRCILRFLISILSFPNFEMQYNTTYLAPRAELLAVRGLKNEELVPSSSTSFSTVVKWEKPLFTLSNVSYYVYGTTEEIKGQMKRRAIRLNNENTTVSYFFVAAVSKPTYESIKCDQTLNNSIIPNSITRPFQIGIKGVCP